MRSASHAPTSAFSVDVFHLSCRSWPSWVTRTFTYDPENRLTNVTGGTAPLLLRYDPLGRLYQTESGSNRTTLLYDGDRLVAEYNTNSGLVKRRYAHGTGVDEPIVWYEGDTLGTKNWLHADERGSIVASTNASGVATPHHYGPYGEQSDWTGSRFRYTGQIMLPEAQLYKARVYDPKLGRFLQTDPIGYEDDVNLYAYSRSDPVNRVDPLGDASVVVARLLSSPVGYLGVGHAFVATNARYLGDPDATIHSFGPLANENMGNVSDPSRAAPGARGTFADDRQAWLRLAYRNVTANVTQIDAPDEVVDAVAKAVAENKPYSYVPGDAETKFTRAGEIQISETNSNSAAFAVGDKAERIVSGDPNAKVDRKPFNIVLPGIGAAGKVDFKSKVMCTGSHIARESC